LKYYLTCILGVLLFFLHQPVSAATQPNNILEYYRRMPHKLFGQSPFKSNKVKFRWIKGKWRLPKGYAFWGKVDIANGYLEVSHASTQACSHTITLYRDNRRTTFIGLTLSGAAQFATKFYRYINGKWIDVTSRLLPPMNLKPFLKGHFPLKKQRAILKYIGRGNQSEGKYTPFTFNLPRYGTRIKIKIQMIAFFQNHQHAGNGINRMIKLLNPDKARYLYWNMAKGKFYWK